jgi:hypothetical protein
MYIGNMSSEASKHHAPPLRSEDEKAKGEGRDMSTYTRMLLLRVVGLATRKGSYMVSRHLHGDMNELDKITDEPHDRETDRDSLGNLNKLYAPDGALIVALVWQ